MENVWFVWKMFFSCCKLVMVCFRNDLVNYICVVITSVSNNLPLQTRRVLSKKIYFSGDTNRCFFLEPNLVTVLPVITAQKCRGIITSHGCHHIKSSLRNPKQWQCSAHNRQNYKAIRKTGKVAGNDASLLQVTGMKCTFNLHTSLVLELDRM